MTLLYSHYSTATQLLTQTNYAFAEPVTLCLSPFPMNLVSPFMCHHYLNADFSSFIKYHFPHYLQPETIHTETTFSLKPSIQKTNLNYEFTRFMQTLLLHQKNHKV